MYSVKSSLYEGERKFVDIDKVFDAVYLWFSRSNTKHLEISYDNSKLSVSPQRLTSSEYPIYFSFMHLLLEDSGFKSISLNARRDTGGSTFFDITKES